MLTGEAIEPFGVGSFASEGPHNVGKMLLDERYLSLYRQFDIVQGCVGTAIRRYAGKYPAASFLVHQTARAVDWIHDNPPHDVRLSGPARQNNLTIFQSFGDEQHGRNRRDFMLKELDQHFFADTIEREDRIALLL